MVRQVSSLRYAIFKIFLKAIFQVWFIIKREISQHCILDGDDLIHLGINLHWITTWYTNNVISCIDSLHESVLVESIR